MKIFLYPLYLFFAVLLLTASAAPPVHAALELIIGNVTKQSGSIWVGIYESEEDFLNREKARLLAVEVIQKGSLTIKIDSLQIGKQYAFALFHDINGNGELDRNFLGIPTEPWAFSRPLPSRFRLPHFHEVKFTLRFQKNQQAVSLRKW